VARVQGFIQEISYTDGDFVKKDTLLFTIEPEPYRLKLLAAQAAEAGSQATLKQAERYVLVVNADNVVEQRRVETGQLVGDLRVIESGLHKEDRAVVGGIMRAIPGRKVEPELRAAAAN
jgi:multidrug efflux pump subunit AcrA (membrane-fusion protein)